jgi:excisionase family DNA binding protein
MNSKKQLPKFAHLRDKGIKSSALVAPVPEAESCFQNQPVKFLINELKYSIKEASKKMGVGETTLRSIIQKGGIAVLNIGGKYMLLERDIEKFLKGNYVTFKENKEEPNRLPPLPENIANSDLIRKAG